VHDFPAGADHAVLAAGPRAIRLKINGCGALSTARGRVVACLQDPLGAIMLICVWWWRLRQANVAVVTFALLAGCTSAHAEVAGIYGNGDGLCIHLAASGKLFDCFAMRATHRSLPFGTLVSVCHEGCVTARINDRGPFVRGRHLDLSPAAVRAIGLRQTGHLQMPR
jgi:rare lipoprotein A